MLFSLSLKTLPGGSNRMTDHDAIRPAARAPTSEARSKNSRKYPFPSYLTAARAVWLHKKILSFDRPGRPHKKSCNQPGLRAVIYFGKARMPTRNGDRSRRTTFICMNAFFARGATAFRNWCHRNFQSAEYSTDASHAALGKGDWSRFFSAARFLTAPAPMIQRPTIHSTANTGTGTTKARPSIVRIIRVRRRRQVYKPRFLGESAGRKIAHS
jgi:hypothetical protein